MPKNTTGGNKSKSLGNKNINKVETELIFAQPGQEYALVTKMLGNRRIKMFCSDGRERLGIIMGRFKSGAANRVEPGMIVLVNIREYSINDDKAEICHIYSRESVAQLKKLGELKWMPGEDQDLFEPGVEGDDDISFEDL